MNLDYLCMGCMKEKTPWTPVCPFCGYDGVNTQNNEQQLPTWTLLNNTYLIGKSLGKGGFGMTYLAFDINLQKKVVIKEYFLGKCAYRNPGDLNVYPYDGDRARLYYNEKAGFVEEARILAQIDEQPGIVKVISYFEANQTAYIVMEYLEGQSLKAYTASRGGYLPADDAVELMKPVIKALAGIHQKGVVHRDISPDNIMITTKGKVKLIDFGAAKDSTGDLSADKVFKQTYSPLEQRIPDGVIGAYSDIYALCATMYQLITGTKVPPANERAVEDRLIPPSALGISINPIHEAAIINGLAVQPSERIKNATDLYYFMYVYGMEQNASNEGMQRKMHESSTEVIVDKLKKESRSRKRAGIASAATSVIAFILMLVLLKSNIFNKSSNSESTETDTGVEITIEDEAGESDYTTEISADTLVDLRESMYEYIRGKNEDVEISSDYEKLENTAVKKAIKEEAADINEAAQNLQDVFAAEKGNDFSEAGYVPVVCTGNNSIETIYDYFASSIEESNLAAAESSGEASDEYMKTAITLENCEKVGIGIAVDANGYYYWILMFGN